MLEWSYTWCSPGFSSHCSSFCGYKGKHRFRTGGRGSSISAESPPPPSVVLPSFLMARPASQIGLPTDSFSGLFVPRLFNGITALPHRRPSPSCRRFSHRMSSFMIFSICASYCTLSLSSRICGMCCGYQGKRSITAWDKRQPRNLVRDPSVH